MKNNNRKTVGLGWDTKKMVRQGITKKGVETPIKLPLFERILNVFKKK